MEKNLNNLKTWLIQCGYPIEIIQKGIHNARLQGPAPNPPTTKIIPLINTYFSNYDNGVIADITQSLIKNSKSPRLIETFKDTKIIQAYRQPPNLLRQLTNSAFITSTHEQTRRQEQNIGIHHCSRSNCKICRLYLQKCDTFTTSNGTVWSVKCHVHCNSKNAIYHLICNFCNEVTYLGKTDSLRDRTNNHITGCRHGTSSDRFDNHVYSCSRRKNKPHVEPFFKLFVYMVLNDYNKLRNYERKLHLQGNDVLNNPAQQ